MQNAVHGVMHPGCDVVSQLIELNPYHCYRLLKAKGFDWLNALTFNNLKQNHKTIIRAVRDARLYFVNL